MNGISPLIGTKANVLFFLTQEYKNNASYSSLNCYRSALSLILRSSLGEDDIVKRFFKGVSKLRPSAPRYDSTWDPKVVLQLFSNWGENESTSLQLEQLSMKLITLLALMTGHRLQTFSLIDIRNIRKVDNESYEIKIPDRIKTSAPNRKQPVLRLPYFTQNKSLCIASALELYLDRTNDLRNSVFNLFISYKKPHKAVTTQTLSRWMKMILSESGVDVNIFTAYSTRHAVTSAAKRAGVNEDLIRKIAGWTKNSATFGRFYNREIASDEMQFAEGVHDVRH